MSIRRGTKPLPNSLCKRSASACLRTEPNTRNPFETSTFVVPQPIPVETPVTTTSLLFAIAFLLRWITVHLQLYSSARCDGILGSLGYPELHHGLGWYLDRLPGGRIPTHARLAVRFDQSSDARE